MQVVNYAINPSFSIYAPVTRVMFREDLTSHGISAGLQLRLRGSACSSGTGTGASAAAATPATA